MAQTKLPPLVIAPAARVSILENRASVAGPREDLGHGSAHVDGLELRGNLVRVVAEVFAVPAAVLPPQIRAKTLEHPALQQRAGM